MVYVNRVYKKMEAITRVLNSMEPICRDQFCRIINFAREVSYHDHENDMNPKNLAICFAPSLLPVSKDEEYLSGISLRIEILQFMIKVEFDLPFSSIQEDIAEAEVVNKLHISGAKLAEIPEIVLECVQFLWTEHRIGTEMIFAKSWENTDKMEEVKQEIKEHNGHPKNIIKNLNLESVHDVSSLLMYYLSNMPSPLINDNLLADLANVCETHYRLEETQGGKCERLNDVLQTMETSNRTILCFLLCFFNAVAANSRKSGMNAHNLALYLVPVVGRVGGWWAYDDPEDARRKITFATKILEIMIRHAWSFAVVDEGPLSDLSVYRSRHDSSRSFSSIVV
mmetsp:Transcript_21915/g.26684  ORF Transcript_21915/g.26684 Transcript_21915/m.26684 type:complete len:339 (+) Transcript_21915:203-1219(+)